MSTTWREYSLNLNAFVADRRAGRPAVLPTPPNASSPPVAHRRKPPLVRGPVATNRHVKFAGRALSGLALDFLTEMDGCEWTCALAGHHDGDDIVVEAVGHPRTDNFQNSVSNSFANLEFDTARYAAFGWQLVGSLHNHCFDDRGVATSEADRRAMKSRADILGDEFVSVIISPRYSSERGGDNWERPLLVAWSGSPSSHVITPLVTVYDWGSSFNDWDGTA
jgi:hypothetical protein